MRQMLDYALAFKEYLSEEDVLEINAALEKVVEFQKLLGNDQSDLQPEQDFFTDALEKNKAF